MSASGPASLPSVDHDRIALAIRCASVAIAAYDYLETLPTAIKFYRHHWQERRATLGISSLLFVLIRLSSMAIITISNVGYFANFSIEACNRYCLLAPIFKVIQGMVSHAILGVRAYNASSRNRVLGWSLTVLYLLVITLQWISTIVGRKAQVTPIGSCRSLSNTTGTLYAAWIYYVLAIAFDFVVTAIAVFYLGKQLKTTRGMLSSIVRIMLRDGIGYLVILTLANAVNAFFYLSSRDLQNAFASVGYTVTWIMSQRLILHLYRASVRKRDEQVMTTTNGLLTVTQNLTTTRSVNHALRSQFSRKDTAFTDLTVPEFSMDIERVATRDSLPENDDEPRVAVRVEKTVRVSNSRKVRYELEDYSRGGPSRNSRQF